MLSYFLLVFLFFPLIFLSALNRKGLVYYVLLTSGFPITMLMPSVSIYGINPQAAYLFLILFAISLACFRDVAFCMRSLQINIVFFIFLFYAFISVAWTSDYYIAIRMLTKLAAPFFLIVSVKMFLRRPNDLVLAEYVIFCCVIGVLIIAVTNNLSGGMLGDPRGTSKWIYRNYLTAPYMSPANFSFLMGSGAILAFGNYLSKLKIIYLLIYIILAAAVCWSFTRISIAGLVVGTSLCLLLLSKSNFIRIIAPTILILTIGIAFLTVDALKERMFFQEKKVSINKAVDNPTDIIDSINTSGRSHLWSIAIKKFFYKSPIFGAGIGSVDKWLGDKHRSMRLHSEYLRILFDLGLIGLSLYLLALTYFFLKLIKIYRSSDSASVEKKYSVVAIATITYYGITLFTDNSLNYVTEFGVYVFTYIGFAHVAYENFRYARISNVAVPPLLLNRKPRK